MSTPTTALDLKSIREKSSVPSLPVHSAAETEPKLSSDLDEFLFRFKFLHTVDTQGIYPEPSKLLVEGPGYVAGWLDFDKPYDNKNRRADVVPELKVKCEKEEDQLRSIVEQLNARIEYLQRIVASIKNKEMLPSQMESIVKKLMHPVKPANLVLDEVGMSKNLIILFNGFIIQYQSFVNILTEGDVDAAYVVIKRRHRSSEMFSFSGLANGTVTQHERNFMNRLLEQLHPRVSEELIYMLDKGYFHFEGKDFEYRTQKFSQEEIVNPWEACKGILNEFQISKAEHPLVMPGVITYIIEQLKKLGKNVLAARDIEDKRLAEAQELDKKFKKRERDPRVDKENEAEIYKDSNNHLKELLQIYMNLYFDVNKLMEPIYSLSNLWRREIAKRRKIMQLRDKFLKKANTVPLIFIPSNCVEVIQQSKEFGELLNLRMNRCRLLKTFETLDENFGGLLVAEKETPMDSGFFVPQFEDLMSKLDEINQALTVIKGQFIQKLQEIVVEREHETATKNAANLLPTAANGCAANVKNVNAHAGGSKANQEVPLTFNIDERKLRAEVREQYKPDALRKTWEMKVSADKKQNAAERKQRLDRMLEPARRQAMFKHEMQAMRELSPDEVKRREERVRKFISVPRIHQLLVHLYSSPKTFGVDELTALIHALQTQGEKIHLKNRDGSHFAYEFRVAANYRTLDGSGFEESLFGFNQKGSQKGFPDNIVANLQSTFTRAGYTKAILGLEDNTVKPRKLKARK